MGKISIDLSSIKAAGIYTIEIDNTQREITNPTSLRLLVGFNNRGPFNRPVFMQYESERQKLFGDIDNRLEQKGCFFNRMAQTMLKNGPVLALNLLKVDDSLEGPDQVNYAAMSLDAGSANPRVANPGKKYGEYDYQAEGIDRYLYDTEAGDIIPYVGKTPYSSLFDRSRFWIPSKINLQAIAANGLGTNDYTTYEHTNLLNFANTGTDEISILVYKPDGLKGYDITAKEWWGGDENIPYGWIRPSDYISDYFIRVVAVKGNWTNYPILSNDPIWGKYFDKNGIIKQRVGQFCSAEGITFIGSWTGCIIPDFIDKQGNYLYIESKVNAVTERTGLMMALNEDAFQNISYDKNGVDIETGEMTGTGTWIYDFDANAEGESDLGETEIGKSGFYVDMVGHNLQNGIYNSSLYECLKSKSGAEYKPQNASGVTPKPIFDYYFLKTNAETTDSSSITYLGVDTSIAPDAVIRAITPAQGSDTSYMKAYVVYNGSTNKPIRGNGKATGVRKFYIVAADGDTTIKDYIYIDSSGGPTKYSKTGEITGMKAYGQTDKTVSYNTNDYLDASLVKDYLSKSEESAATTKGFYLKEEPVVEDTNDIFLYTDTSVNYGLYAMPVMKEGANPSIIEGVELFTVTSGIQNSDYAIVSDLGTITEDSLPIRLSKFYASVDATEASDDASDICVFDPSIEKDDGSTTYFKFIYNGDEYAISGDGEELFRRYLLDKPSYFGINFLSYNYLTNNVNDIISTVYDAYYFNGEHNYAEETEPVSFVKPASTTDEPAHIYTVEQDRPVSETNLNQFIICNDIEASLISVGDYVNNIAFNNQKGECERYNLIPGVTRIINKVFVNVDARNEFYYLGKRYHINTNQDPNKGEVGVNLIKTNGGKQGFYLFTALDPVYINHYNQITRQYSLANDVISHSLKFIPMKGLHISAKHRPGFDEYGRVNIDAGITKIYSMLADDSIKRGLCNPNMVDYRYIVDSMSYGLDSELGGKVYLSQLARDRMKTTALLNLPSKRQFELSEDPCFCETYEKTIYSKPPFNTKYIPMGGNSDLYNTKTFSLPSEENGSKFTAAFWPHLTYNSFGRRVSVPPAADVCDVLIRKFQGGDPYVISANRNGIIRNDDVVGVEFMADVEDREYLEPFGVNTIIQDNGQIMIYGNQTCYQDTVSDFNKLHVRENLNTLEIACESVLKSYNFLYNTPATRASIVTALTPILEAMKLSMAIEKYNIVCDESNNTPEIIAEHFGVVDIEVWMNHGMEKIVQRITLNRRDTLED